MPFSNRHCHDNFSIMLVNRTVVGKVSLYVISLGGFVRIAVNFTAETCRLSLWLHRKSHIPLIVSLLKLFISNRAMCEVLDDLRLILRYDCEIYTDNDPPTRAAENTENSSHT